LVTDSLGIEELCEGPGCVIEENTERSLDALLSGSIYSRKLNFQALKVNFKDTLVTLLKTLKASTALLKQLALKNFNLSFPQF
jgi:hypothetical protein